MVVGSSGDYFDVCHRVIAMDGSYPFAVVALIRPSPSLSNCSVCAIGCYRSCT
jgi:hypothetical protein